MLGTLDGDLLTSLASVAFQTENQFLGSLGLKNAKKYINRYAKICESGLKLNTKGQDFNNIYF